MDEINNGFATIAAIEEHIEKLRVRQNDQAATASRRHVLNDFYEHKIDVLTKSLKAVYEKIEEVVNQASAENNSDWTFLWDSQVSDTVWCQCQDKLIIIKFSFSTMSTFDYVCGLNLSTVVKLFMNGYNE